MTPEIAGPADWQELAARFRAAADDAAQAARRPPLSGAEALMDPLTAVCACLDEAFRLLRSGNREDVEPFRQELEQWAADLPVLRAWMEASAALAAGWAAAAGVSPGYGPAGQRPGEAGPGLVSHCG